MSYINDYLEQLISISSGQQQEYFKWIHRNIKIYTKKDVLDETGEYQRHISQANLKACFANSRNATFKTPGLKYLEGFYCLEGMKFLCLEHAFNITPDNKVLDTTSMNFGFDVCEWGGIEIPKEFLKSKEYKARYEFCPAPSIYYQWLKKENRLN